MGVITNGPAQHQWDKVQALGLTKWIPRQNILVSGEAGAAKPDRKIFDLAVCKMGLDRTEAYYIGDSPANDIVGAANAGWRTIWFNRRNKKAFSIKPDYTVCSEQELCNLIMKLAGL